MQEGSRKDADGLYYLATFICPSRPIHVHRFAQMHIYNYSVHHSALHMFQSYTHIRSTHALRYTLAHGNTAHIPEYHLLTCKTQHIHKCNVHAHTRKCSMPTHACSTIQECSGLHVGKSACTYIVPGSSHKYVRASPDVKVTSIHMWSPRCPYINRHMACWNESTGECRWHTYEDGPGTQM